MAYVTPTVPNLVDYTTFIETSVQIPTAALPTNSPWLGYAFNEAMELVLCPPCNTAPHSYVRAVYNCATAIQFLITPDQSGQTYFADARSSETSANFPNGGFSLNLPQLGLVVASSDEATSTTLTAPKFAAGLTPSQLQFFATPWGRDYLGWQASYGSTIVDVT